MKHLCCIPGYRSWGKIRLNLCCSGGIRDSGYLRLLRGGQRLSLYLCCLHRMDKVGDVLDGVRRQKSGHRNGGREPPRYGGCIHGLPGRGGQRGRSMAYIWTLIAC